MLTLAAHLSREHIVDIFWDDSQIKAPLAKFLKIDLSRTRFVENIFKKNLLEKSFATLGYNCIFILSDGSVPFSLASKNILHFQVPFKFSKISLKTKINLKRFKWVVTNSKFTKGYIDKSYGVNSQVVYPPVEIDSIKKGEKDKLILSVGRFSQNQLHPKKQEVLIEVFKELYKKIPGWKLVLIGQAKKEDYKYLRRLKKSTLGHAIRIVENLSFEKLRKYYSKASIYWHATGFGEDEESNPQKMEHFGIATVEAQAAGAVPIVIGKGGQKEIVTHEKNGLLWSTKTQLYEFTLNLINDKEKLAKLSQNAILSSRRFSAKKFIGEYEKILF